MTHHHELSVANDTTAGGLKVLIVDDEPMLRSVIQDFLLMLGFKNQYVAGDGVEALEVIRSESIDCMLSDIRMPKMALEELLSVVQREFPKLIVVATSGYSDLESARNIFMKGAHDFLGKPLNLDALELALQWIVERQKVLLATRTLFGASAEPLDEPLEAEARLDELAEILRQTTHHFKSKVSHAIRMARLIRRSQLDLDPVAKLDLELACLLHELGTGYQIQSLCRQPRRLEEDELLLVQDHAWIAGRLVTRALDRPEFESIIGRHLSWQTAAPAGSDGFSQSELLSLWLGIFNTVDGCMHDRPDRPAILAGQVREMLNRRYLKHALAPLGLLLDQWPVVDAFYAACS